MLSERAQDIAFALAMVGIGPSFETANALRELADYADDYARTTGNVTDTL